MQGIFFTYIFQYLYKKYLYFSYDKCTLTVSDLWLKCSGDACLEDSDIRGVGSRLAAADDAAFSVTEGGVASFVGATETGGVGSLNPPPGFETSGVDCLGAGSDWESSWHFNVIFALSWCLKQRPQVRDWPTLSNTKVRHAIWNCKE